MQATYGGGCNNILKHNGSRVRTEKQANVTVETRTSTYLFTRTPCSASSIANARVIATTAP